jgi:hypothetical protein
MSTIIFNIEEHLSEGFFDHQEFDDFKSVIVAQTPKDRDKIALDRLIEGYRKRLVDDADDEFDDVAAELKRGIQAILHLPDPIIIVEEPYAPYIAGHEEIDFNSPEDDVNEFYRNVERKNKTTIDHQRYLIQRGYLQQPINFDADGYPVVSADKGLWGYDVPVANSDYR